MPSALLIWFTLLKNNKDIHTHVKHMNYQQMIEAAQGLHANQLEPLIDELREMLKYKKSLLPKNASQQKEKEEDYMKEIVPCTESSQGFQIIEYKSEGEHRLVLFCTPDGDDLVYSLYTYEEPSFKDIAMHIGEGWLEAFTPVIQGFFKNN